MTVTGDPNKDGNSDSSALSMPTNDNTLTSSGNGPGGPGLVIMSMAGLDFVLTTIGDPNGDGSIDPTAVS